MVISIYNSRCFFIAFSRSGIGCRRKRTEITAPGGRKGVESMKTLAELYAALAGVEKGSEMEALIKAEIARLNAESAKYRTEKNLSLIHI